MVGPSELSAGPSVHGRVGVNWTSPVDALTELTSNVTPAQAESAAPVPTDTANTPGSGALHVATPELQEGVCEMFETAMCSA